MICAICSFGIQAQLVIHQEDFEDCEAVTWTNVRGNGDQDPLDFWSCELSEDALYSYAFINGFSGDLDEDWLVSPVIDLKDISSSYFQFKYRNIFTGPDVELLYSTEFSGVNSTAAVNSATWEFLPLDFYDIFTNDLLSNAIFHKAIDLSFLKGEEVYLAFRYKNDTSDSERWEIDDVLVIGDYYQGIIDKVDSGMRCAELKTSVHELIKGHTTLDYSGQVLDVWDAYHTTDRRLSDDGERIIVYDMTTDIPDGPEQFEFRLGVDRDMGTGGGSEGDKYNREHSFPKSWWGGGNDPVDTMFFDLHHLIPSDKYINGFKSFLPIGNVGYPDILTSNGTKMGTHSGPVYSGKLYEPIDEYKGDYARMYFYMAARYESRIAGWEDNSLSSDAALNGDSYTVYEDWLLQTLLQWHESDPVSTKEIERNDAIFSFQKNRNPFIDYSEWVGMIWGKEDGTDCDIVTALVNDKRSQELTLFPSPARNVILCKSVSSATLQIEADVIIYNMDSHIVKRFPCHDLGREMYIGDLSPRMYFLLVQSQNGTRQLIRFGKI